MTTEESARKLSEWLETDEGKAAMKKAVEEAQALRKKIEKSTKVDPEVLKKKCNI